MKKLLLLDLDGVLFDTKANMMFAWNAVQHEFGLDISFEEYFRFVGKPFLDILTALGIERDRELVEKLFRQASLSNIQRVQPFPAVPETLKELASRGVMLGVVTSKDFIRTDLLLKRLEVRFQTVQCPNERVRGKPAPDHLLLAIIESGVDPSESVYVGDMESDVEAAQRAGVDYVHASWGYGLPPRRAEQINSFADVKIFFR